MLVSEWINKQRKNGDEKVHRFKIRFSYSINNLFNPFIFVSFYLSLLLIYEMINERANKWIDDWIGEIWTNGSISKWENDVYVFKNLWQIEITFVWP